MPKQSPTIAASRRDFLRSSVALSAGAAAVAVTGTTVAATTDLTPEAKSPEKKGYRLTRHVADYYKAAAF